MESSRLFGDIADTGLMLEEVAGAAEYMKERFRSGLTLGRALAHCIDGGRWIVRALLPPETPRAKAQEFGWGGHVTDQASLRAAGQIVLHAMAQEEESFFIAEQFLVRSTDPSFAGYRREHTIALGEEVYEIRDSSAATLEGLIEDLGYADSVFMLNGAVVAGSVPEGLFGSSGKQVLAEAVKSSRLLLARAYDGESFVVAVRIDD